MAQITSGVRSILSVPAFYEFVQSALGAKRARRVLAKEYLRVKDGDVVVDVGCGPAEILDLLPHSIDYHGFDLSEAYINSARTRHGDRGSFHCRDVTAIGDSEIPLYNVVIIAGVLHHIDDEGVIHLLSQLRKRIAVGGRVVSIDPAYWVGQHVLARTIISNDRGQNVRFGGEYEGLARSVFPAVQLHRRDDLLRVPYSHAILEMAL